MNFRVRQVVMGRILIIEDSLEIIRILKDALRSYDLYFVTTIREAKAQILQQSNFDLILLDIGLPDGDGLEFMAMIKSQKEEVLSPVIFLTSKNETSSVVMAFSLGADDYIIKPFNPFEFRARIEAKMKAISSRKVDTNLIILGDLKLNTLTLKVQIMKSNEIIDINLTPLEFRIISFFAKHEDQVFSRNQLINQIWGGEVNLNDRAIDTHMSNIRKKIKMSQYTLSSIYGAGYALKKAQQAS